MSREPTMSAQAENGERYTELDEITAGGLSLLAGLGAADLGDLF